MDIKNNVPLKEAAKEIIRLQILAIVAWLITWAGGQSGEVWVTATVLLRGLDRWIHEHPNKFNGLLPF